MRKLKLHQLGFTIIELLITLAIAATLFAIGLPSFNSFMDGKQITTTTNDYIFSLHKARSEAVKRSTGAGLCPSANSMTAAATCDNGGSYSDGWIVYADENQNRQQDAGEEIVHRMEARSNGFTFVADPVLSDQVYFNESGNSVTDADIPVSGVINIKYAAGSLVRDIFVSANGRVAVEDQ